MSEAEVLEPPSAPDDLSTLVEMIEDLYSARKLHPEGLRFHLLAPLSTGLSLG